MATAVESDDKIEERIADLIRLERAALATYDAAIDRLHSAELRAKLGEFAEDHRRHCAELDKVLADMGHTMPRKGDAKRFLTRGKVVLGGLIGDTAVLYAMRSNEDEANAAYAEAAALADLSADARRVIEDAGEDERRHRDWITAKLKEMRDG